MKPISGNATKLRQINRDIILAALKARDSASIAELSRLTGLSVGTCANIVPELLANGEVVELGERTSQGGRPARRFAHNPDNTLVLALVLKSVRNVETLSRWVTNAADKTVEAGIVAEPRVTPEDFDNAVADAVARHPSIRAVAISIPGVVGAGVVETCDIADFIGIDLEKRVLDTSGLGAFTDNDMNFSAMGYYQKRPERHPAGLAYIIVPDDTNVGCGMIVNGALVRGRSNFAGELSHIPFAGGGRTPGRNRTGGDTFVMRICCAVAAVINPDVIVLCGEAAEKTTPRALRAACLPFIPERHLPEIVIKPSYEEDCLAGMTAMALAGISSDIQLVERGGRRSRR